MKLINLYQQIVSKLPVFDGIPALLIRLYLAPVFIIAGYNKLNLSDPEVAGFKNLLAQPSFVQWLGNSDWGLGLPFADFLANLAAWSEFLGGWLLIIGLLTRLITIPLMFTMLIAMTSVHAPNGWFAITPTDPDSSPATVLSWFGVESARLSIDNSHATNARLSRMREILAQHGDSDWLFANGNIVVLNNGIEFAFTYLLFLLALFFIGAGRFTSLDYFIARKHQVVTRDGFSRY